MSETIRTLDFEHDVWDDVSALKAFDKILRGEIDVFYMDGRRLSPGQVFKNPRLPISGFQEGILPKHIENIRAGLPVRCTSDETMADVYHIIHDLRVSYDGQIDQEQQRERWESKGFIARDEKRSLAIYTPEQRELVEIIGSIDPKRASDTEEQMRIQTLLARCHDSPLVQYGKNRSKIHYARFQRYTANCEPISPTDLR